MTCIIYALCDPDTSAIRYVGQTVNVERRLNQHTAMSNPDTKVAKWISDLQSEGKLPSMVVLEECDTDLAAAKEKDWIRRLAEGGCSLLNTQFNVGVWEKNNPRKSLPLLPEQWERLDALAADLAGPATRGANIGAPSWRTLLRDIADGKLAVVPATQIETLAEWQGWEQAAKEVPVMIYRGSDIDAAEAQP